MLIFLIESLTWKLSFGGLEAWQASAFIFLIEGLTWKLNVGGLEDWGVSVLIFLIESLTWKLSFGGLEARQCCLGFRCIPLGPLLAPGCEPWAR